MFLLQRSGSFDPAGMHTGRPRVARMNRLFGVTMAERGVSQLVSVDLENAVKILDQNVA